MDKKYNHVLSEQLRKLFERDIVKVSNEIDLYKSEDCIWLTDHLILNSGGNLCLHLIGNLNAYIGNGLGDIGYIRNRELEFSQKHLPKNQLLSMMKETIKVVDISLQKINDDDLQKDFPIVVWDKPFNMLYTLVHLHSHLNYHLGQINYHRRLLDL